MTNDSPEAGGQQNSRADGLSAPMRRRGEEGDEGPLEGRPLPELPQGGSEGRISDDDDGKAAAGRAHLSLSEGKRGRGARESLADPQKERKAAS